MSLRFDNVVIIGVGLLGGSLGLAMKQRGLAGRITGIGRSRTSLEKAIAHGAIDVAVMDSDLAGACAGADLIVVSTPVQHAVATVRDLAACVSKHAVATDVASTKAAICSAAASTWPVPRRFIGSHPMAGSEKHGPEHACADLFEKHVCLVEQADGICGEAHAAVAGLWQAVGARVVNVRAVEHDETLARTSHLPHVVAAALAQVVAGNRDLRDFVGNGFRDTTRIAASRPEVWRDICLSNRDALLHALEDYEDILRSVRDALGSNDAAALEGFFSTGNEARKRIVG